MSFPPSTSSTSLPAEIGRKRSPPPELPKTFHHNGSSVEKVGVSPRNPFRSSSSSGVSTPRSPARNPFSPSPSVFTLGAESNVDITLGANADSRSEFRSTSKRSSVNPALRSSVSLREPSRGTRRTSTSRPRGSFQSPPIMSRSLALLGDAPSRMSLAAPKPKRLRSTRLNGTIDKPWVGEKDIYARVAYWMTYAISFLGIAGSAVLCFFGWKDVPRLGNICLVMEDNFNTFDTTSTWSHEVDMSGFGNGQFEMTTDFANNSFVQNGQLFMVPTLTSDAIGMNAVFNGFTYNITGCTNTNTSACGAVSNFTTGTVINPVMSARLTTRNSHSIQFGKVEIVAKMPRGDWLYPAISLLPVDNAYGPWPLSGEIAMLQARGNGPEYKAQGIDFVRGSLNWGPLTWLNGVSKTFGAWTNRRKSYDQGFHTYTVEWSPKFIRIYVDSRLHKLINIQFNIPFFQRGQFPQTVANGSQTIVTPNPWVNGTNASPFDKPFFLVMNLGVGGTNGWFPDGVGNKPWLDGSLTAMRDFALAQNDWFPTWGQSMEDRAMIIDSVKMWQSC